MLDLGTGTGTLLDDLTTRAADASIVGLDIAEGMLRVAKRDHAALFAAANASLLPVADETFDVAVSAFVIFNVPDPHAALSEVRRVLRAGAMFGMTTWGPSADDRPMEIWNEELAAHGAPDEEEMPQGREEINAPDKLAAVLAGAGFSRNDTWTGDFAYTWQRVEDWLDFAIHGRRGIRLNALPEETRASCLQRITERLATLTPDELTDRAEIVYATAAR